MHRAASPLAYEYIRGVMKEWAVNLQNVKLRIYRDFGRAPNVLLFPSDPKMEIAGYWGNGPRTERRNDAD